jgi:hypothetical protein
MIKRRVSVALAVMMLSMAPSTHAGLIEDLMALPAIQSLLGRVPELAPLLTRCESPAYRQANLVICEQAEQAAKIAKAPPELRAVMASKPAATSLRALCIETIGRPAGSSYLCAELVKLDSSLQAERARIEAERARPVIRQDEGGHNTR